VIADPPLLAGAVQLTVACALPAVAVPIVGAPGAVMTICGVTGVVAPENAPVPAEFTAATSNVYAVPFVSPPITALVAVAPDTGVVETSVVPENARTEYPVIADPPLFAGAVQVTVACALPAVAVPIVGAPGALIAARGVTADDRVENAPVATALTAATSNVYAVPFVSPAMIVLVAAPFVTGVVETSVVPENVRTE
jgi:hypothetical protein